MKLVISEKQLELLRNSLKLNENVDNGLPACSGLDDCTKKWGALNQNPQDKRAFGSGFSRNESIAYEKAYNQAQQILSQKLKQETISTRVVGDKTFMKNGEIFYTIIVISSR